MLLRSSTKRYLQPYVLLVLGVTAASCSGPRSDDGDFRAESIALDVPAGAEGYVPTLEGPLRILSATPEGTMLGMVPEQAVTVTFSQPMVPLGDAPDVPEGTIRLTPDIPGRLRWEGTQTLVFQPEEPLPLATGFRATLAGGLTSLSEETLTEPYSWTFETPRPRLVRSEPPSGELYTSPQQALRLEFNQRIRAEGAERFVRLQREQNRQQAVPISLRPNGDSTLVVQPPTHLQPSTTYELLLLPGLPSAEGPLGLQDTTLVRFRTYGPLRFTGVTQARTWRDRDRRDVDPGRGITLAFSTPVRFADLRRVVSFSPEIDLPPGIEARDSHVSDVHTLSLPLEPETEYMVTVRDLGDVFGQRLDEGSARFRTRAYDPSVNAKRGLLVIEAEEEPVVPVRATNVASLRMGAVRLSAEDIIPLLPVYDRDHWYGEPRADEQPEPIAAARTVPLNIPRNRPSTVPLRVDSLLSGRTGVVALRLVGPPQPGETTVSDFRAIAQVTRLGLTGKFSAQRNLILVTDLRSAAPVSGASVTIRDADNHVRWRGRTDAEGRAVTPGWAALGIPRRSSWETPTQYAFAEVGRDMAFTSSLYIDGLHPYRFGVDYVWWPEPQVEEGSIFTDRGLYRAGETAHVKGILRRRGETDWEPITDSVRVFLVSPRNQVALDRRLKPSDLGTFDLDWTAPASADQGAYSIRVAHVADTAAARREEWERGDIAQGWLRVDAFRTATFAVSARTSAASYVAGDFFEGSIEGRYLFGAPMGGQPVRYSLNVEPGYYAPPGYDEYRFGAIPWYDQGVRVHRSLLQADTVLNEDGRVEARIQLPGNEIGSPTTIVWSGTVEDPSRQEIAGRAQPVLHPGTFYVGLKPRTTFLDVSREEQISVDLITVDPGGRPVASRGIEVELIRQQWNSVREVGADGRLTWRSERTEEPKGRQRVETEAGRAVRLTMPVTEGGSYLVRASAYDVRGNVIRSEAHFYATGRGYVAWERTDDDRIDLVPERTSYRPGERARLMVQSPYEEATALITVEREGILSSRIETLRGSAPQIEIPLDETHLPNVFVSVVLLKGRTARPGATSDGGAPGFKMGYASLRVDPGERHLQVEVEADRETYRPGEEVTVTLRLRDAGGRGVPGEIAFSAADAGVLNLIGYALPDPFDAFYGPQPLGVTTSETRANLIEQRSFGQKEEDLVGGGGDPEYLMRRDFRPLAHWDPAVRTDERGRATVTFRLPESLTTFRLMASALTGDNRFGAGQSDVTVSQPLVILPALPRFARLDDRFEAGVLVTNLTGAAGPATITARAEGLELAGSATETVRLEPDETREVRFAWNVGQAGDARLTFEGRMGGERDALTVPLTVSLPTTKTTSATFASTDGTASEALRLPSGHLPGLGRFEARLSSTALVGLDGASRFLFTYPYGCLEQRTSAVRPLLVGAELLDAFDLNALDGDREEVVQTWIRDLNDFWLGDGFAMWRGDRAANPYVSAYVVLAMAEAKDAGYAIPPDLVRQAVDLLDRWVRRRSERPEFYTERTWDDGRALMLYALARHGRILESEIGALTERDALSTEGRSLLLRTIVLANRPALARYRTPLIETIRRPIRVEATTAYLTAPDDRDYEWIFASDTRATAYGLAALVEAAGPDAAADTRQLAQRMVRYLMDLRRNGHWASTQDNASVLDAFRAFYLAYERAAPDLVAEVRVAGQRLLREQFRGRTLEVAEGSRPLTDLPEGENVPVEVAMQGDGRVYYSLLLETYSREPQPAAQNGLAIERRIQRLDDRGQPVGESMATGSGTVQLTAGEIVRVTLRLTSPTDRNYVVVDDALPAGLEVLNAAFVTTDREALAAARDEEYRWWGSFNHTEIRDDRVLLFADYLGRGEHSYTYVARATTPGTFVHPHVQAEMMYRPEVFGRTGVGAVDVAAPASATASR